MLPLEERQQSFLFKNKRINVISNTLDVNVYKPIDKNKARVVFNLPQDKSLILFGTMSLKDYRKGFELLKGSLNYLSQTYPVYKDKIEVIIFGSSEQSHSLNIPYKNSFLGKLRSKEEISFCYNAADVFVAPSIEDNLPNAVMESLSCGTPVVAFEIGGMPDMIVHKKNGYLAEPNSIQSLSNGIYWILTDDTKRKQLGFSAREKVLKNFTYESIATKYIQLYNSIL